MKEVEWEGVGGGRERIGEEEEQHKEKYQKSNHYPSLLCDIRRRKLTDCCRCFGMAYRTHIRDR